MSDPRPPGAPDSTAYHPSGGERPALTVAHGEAVFPDGAEPSDDAPTIISRKSPARTGSSGPHAEGIIGGSLRGRTLAHFELIEPIGVGGMAAVIRARDRQLDRLVALKILPPEMSGDPENVRRFHQEARAAAKLDHENIARVFFCGEDQRLHFIAFEFVEGINLRTLLERRGRVPVHEAVHYLLQIATGLAHAASRGVVHRDIKPSNIIISPNGRAKLVDMGLARNMGPQSERDLTQSGVTLGTFDYIAPEQAMDPREADVRSDIYSLGCTFYHMLTGQPPVPEGTAAKKLHFHQQVAPVDPRQLNPSIPDEVAAILQRMMAKDPKDRYQRAEHLVQHFIQVLQKLGGAADLPDGVLFVDAPLPSPPAKRPLLMAVVGVLLLGVLLIVLSLAPGQSDTPRPFRPVAAAQAERLVAKEPPRPADKKKPEAPPDAPEPLVITSESGLRAAEARPTAAVLKLDGAIPIKDGVTFKGNAERHRTVESKDPTKPARIRVLAARSGEGRDGWGALEVVSGSVTFKDLIFEIDAKTAPETLLAGVLVRRGAGKVTFVRCTFLQPQASMDALIPRLSAIPIASVAAWNPGRSAQDRPELTFTECYFASGQAAISVLGSATVRPTNCAFGPHVTLFHVRGEEDRNQPPNLDLKAVSALLVYGPAFRLDKGVSCDIAASDSIFSRVGDAFLDRYDPLNLIQQTGTADPTVHFTGRHNCYHGLNAFWWRGPGERERDANLEDFRLTLRARGGYDRDSITLDVGDSPWLSPDPLALAQTEPRTAFEVKPTLAALRLSDKSRLPLGVKECAWGKMPLLPLPEPVAVAERRPNEKLVDPLVDEKTPGVYHTLGAAILDAKDGDVILIKHNGRLEVRPATLEVNQSLTIRPEPGYRPILTVARGTVEAEALFALYHGQLRFEGLEILLKPDPADSGKLQAVVALKGNGQCSFKKCAITLEQPTAGARPLSVVALSEARDAMRMKMKGVPEIAFEKCTVRGEGELLAVRGSRLFVLDVNGSLAVLHGSLVSVECNDLKPMAGSDTAEVKLTGTTTYLQDHLLSLRGKSGKSLVFTQVSANDCLFAAAGKKALVHIEGPDTEDQMRGIFGWRGKQNAYSGFDKFLEQVSFGEGGVPLLYDQDRWKAFTNEADPDPRFVPLVFDQPAGERAFLQVQPQQFRLKAESGLNPRTCGAPVDQLPRPTVGEAARSELPVMPAAQPGGASEGGSE